MLEAKYQQNDCISCLPHSKVEGAQVALHQDQGGGQPGQVGGADRTRAAVQQRQYSVEHSRLYGITGLNRLRRPLPSRYKLTYQSVVTRLYKRRRTGKEIHSSASIVTTNLWPAVSWRVTCAPTKVSGRTSAATATRLSGGSRTRWCTKS